jgi:hypothetical protein
MTLGIHSASWRTWLDCNINHKQAGLAPLSDSPEDLQNFVSFEKLFNSLTAVGINRYLGREGAHEFKIEWRYYLDEFYKASGLFLEGHRNVEFPTGSIRPPAVQVC